jgi:hypothetical protein
MTASRPAAGTSVIVARLTGAIPLTPPSTVATKRDGEYTAWRVNSW